jgi:hypothetical protein
MASSVPEDGRTGGVPDADGADKPTASGWLPPLEVLSDPAFDGMRLDSELIAPLCVVSAAVASQRSTHIRPSQAAVPEEPDPQAATPKTQAESRRAPSSSPASRMLLRMREALTRWHVVAGMRAVLTPIAEKLRAILGHATGIHRDRS